MSEDGTPQRPFVWLASYPKSGNTWLRIFLGSCLNGSPVNPNFMPKEVHGSDLKTYLYQTVTSRPLDTLNRIDFLDLRGAAMQHMMSLGGKWPQLTKTHNARIDVMGTKLIPDHWSDKAVIIVRDPRDIVPSWADHSGLSIEHVIKWMANENAMTEKGEGHSAPRLCHYLSTWSIWVDSWMKAPFPCLAVKYEDMVANPEEAFRQILDFLEWKVPDPVFEMAIKWTSFDYLQAFEDRQGFAETSDKAKRFFRSGKVGGYKDVLTPKQIKQIENDHRDVMQAFGYLPKLEMTG